MRCILCGNRLVFFLSKNGYRIYRCSKCHLCKTDLKKDYEKFVKDFYCEGYYVGDPTRSAYVNYERDKPYIVRNMKKFLSFIKPYKTEGRLLDVGCAFGYFVELALSHGYDARGIDPSSYALRKAQLLVGKKRVSEATIEAYKQPNGSYDIITMFDVFEHLKDPLSDMRKLHRMLKNDGIILIATGDTNSIAARILKRRWTFFIPPQHIFFFNRDNATKLLNNAGFTPIFWHRVGKWVSLGYVLHLARTTGESMIASWLYQRIQHTPFMRIPLYIPMHDNMVIVARKS